MDASVAAEFSEFAPASYLIGTGVTPGGRWSERAYVGPWGTCIGGPGGGRGCWRTTRLATVSNVGAASPVTNSSDQDGTWFVVVAVAPSVSYVAVTRADGSTIRLRPVPAGGARFCVVASPKGSRWVAYSAAGAKLASGGVP